MAVLGMGMYFQKQTVNLAHSKPSVRSLELPKSEWKSLSVTPVI